MIHEKAPDKILTIIIVSGSAFRQAFDGTVGWAEDPADGLREQTGAELAEAKRQADFYSPLDVREHYSKLTFTGKEKVDEHDAYVVEAALPEGGQPDKLYFDVAVRAAGKARKPASFAGRRLAISGGFRRLPESRWRESAVSRSRRRGGDRRFTVKINEVRHNVEH